MSHDEQSRGLFGSLLARIFTGTAGSREEPSAPLRDTERRLQAALEQMEERLRRFEEESGLSHDVSAARVQAEATYDREAGHLRMQEDLVRLHLLLETGMTAAEMQALRRVLEGHAPAMRPGPRPTIEEQIDANVLTGLFVRTAGLAWLRLEELMGSTGVQWPVPEDLLRGREEDERGPVLEQHRGEVRDGFLSTPVDRVAALVCGEVSCWSHYYPRPGSVLWDETALRGVGAGLHARLFARALEVWLWRSSDLVDDIQRVLSPHLDELQAQLRGGITSVETARRVAQEIGEACRLVIPARVWEAVAPRLSWDRPDRVSQTEAVARGDMVEDPVCGMVLSREQAADSVSWTGESWHFCSRMCRERFEATPGRYAAQPGAPPR